MGLVEDIIKSVGSEYEKEHLDALKYWKATIRTVNKPLHKPPTRRQRLTNEDNAATIVALEEDLENAQETIEELLQENAELRATVEAAQSSAADASMLEEANKDLQAADAVGNDALRAELEKAKATIATLLKENEDLQAKVDAAAAVAPGENVVASVTQNINNAPPEEGPLGWTFARTDPEFPRYLHLLTQHFPKAASIVDLQVTLEDGTVAMKNCIQFHDNYELQKVLKRCDGDLNVSSSSLKSFTKFTRALTEWGFKKVGNGKTWRHDKFVRDRPDLAAEITRPQE